MSIASVKNDILSKESVINAFTPLAPTISSYNILVDAVIIDDTAIDTSGGQTIQINGTSFAQGAIITLDGSTVTTAYVSPNKLTFTAPVKTAGTYAIYVVNLDGGTAIYIPGLVYSGTPVWTSAAGSLGSIYETNSISTTAFTTTGDAPITYALYSGTLPVGSSLNTDTGVITGTAPVDSGSTVYSFTIKATDAQLQDSLQSFTLTINTDTVTWSSPANNSTTTLSQNTASTTALSASSAAGKSITYTSDTLPTGLSISGDSVTGSPTVLGSTTSLFTATAATSGRTATRTINWTITVANDVYFMYNSLLLSGGTSTSTFIADESVNNFALTIVGDTKPNNFNPYTPGYYSMYSPTTSDYYSYSDTTTGNFGTGDFTVESWFYATASAHNIIMNSVGTATWAFLTYGNQFYWQENGGNYGGGGYGTVPTNQWVHLAVSRTGGYLNLYINGVRVLNSANTYNYSGTPTRYIGPGAGGSSTFWLSNVRFIKGTGIYSGATITVPTSPLTAIANTSLLTAQSNRMIDNSANAIVFTKAGSPTVQSFTPFVPNTAYAAYGSTYFDGSGDYLSVPSSSSSSFGTGNFTVECWVYMTANSSYRMLLGNGTSYLCIVDGALNAYYSGVSISSSATVALNTWTHVAFVRSAGTMYFYINGALSNSTAFAGTWGTTGVSTIGYSLAYSGLYYYTGYISNFRIVNGTAVYTSAFTPPTAPLTAVTGTSLLTVQTNQPVNNSVFLDNSTNSFSVTRAGNATQGTFSPYGANWSNYFGTKTDYISVPATAALTTFTGDFTFECWVNPTDTSISTTWGIWDSRQNGQTASAMIFFLTGLASPVTGQWRLSYYNSGSQYYGTGVVYANQWTHVAFVRSGSTLTYYVNGVAGGTTSVGAGTISGSATSNPVYIGTKDGSLGGYGNVGYISNFRIVNGVAVYTGNFTPPTAPLTSTQSSGTNIAAITGSATSLLTCQSNRPVDNSANAYALTLASATVSTQRFSPFSPQTQTPITHSAYFDGTGDYLTVPFNSAFNLGSGNFTIEFWVNTTSTAAYATALRLGDTWTTGSWAIYLNTAGGSGTPSWWSFTLNTSLSTSGATINDGAWHHIALVRNSTTMTMYIDGTSRGTLAVSTSSVGDTTTKLWIARDASNVRELAGYLSNIRIVKGTAVYTAAFTPPTAPLTAITNTSLLLNMNSAGIYDSASVNNLETVADAKRVSTHTPYAGSYYSNYFDGTGDVFTVSNNSGFNFSGDFIIEAWLYPTAFGQASCNFMTHWSSGSNVYVFRVLNTGRLQFLYTSGATTLTGTSTTVSLNQWSHVAVCRSGSTLRIFVNGIADTTTATYSGTLTGGGPIAVGAHNDTSEGWTGYISNLRVVNTPSSPYTTTFTPSTTPLTSITGTALLTCQSNRFIDNSSNAGTITKSGNVAVESFNPFQRNSGTTMYFDGTGDALVIPYNPVFNFGVGNFTIEFWTYVTATPSTEQYFLAVGPAGSGGANRGWRMAAHNGTAAGIYFYPLGIGSEVLLGSFPNASAWHHIAIVRNSTTITGYVDGTALGTTINASTTAITDISSGDYSFVGGLNSSGATPRLFYNGYINDLRITKGIARYTTNFTPPTTALLTY